MPKLETQGKIEKIFDTQVISDRFQKREFVLRVEDGQYPQEILFQLTQDKCSMLEGFEEGDEIKIACGVQGRKWQRSPQDEPRWFNSLNVFKLEKAGDSAGSGDIPLPDEDDMPDFNQDPDDDIPF